MDWWTLAFGILAILVGLALCFIGYRLFLSLLFLVGFVVGYGVCASLLYNYTTFAFWIIFLIGLAAGLVAGILTRILWIIAVFIMGALGGFILGCFILSMGDGALIPVQWGVWLFLGLLMLLCGIVSVFLIKPAIIVLTAFCGGYAIVAGAAALMNDNSLFTPNFVEIYETGTVDIGDKSWETWVLVAVW
eukprot:CAMPEP_0119123182 /NCGR_PEP_ID=MMETSP1310-20130426/3206_1 /TAXON_ID=464262 /ORGANISM="Genus nov. species nov., Strain RCC2339" /LENGTH=189 /DNA_ID=CAMNT_0007112947 /DNA_START=85 /DNA_END=651 /DNA_ORIENTATION=-